MGSRSAKLSTEKDSHNAEKGNVGISQPVKNEENDIPNMLVSLVRNKTVLVSEGRSVATQTDANDLADVKRGVTNGAVIYDTETVESGNIVEISVPSRNHQDQMLGEANKRERSDMGTNTVVTAIERSDKSDEHGKPRHVSDKENAVVNDSENYKSEISDVQNSLESTLDEISLERYGKYRLRVESDKEKCTISAVAFLDTGDLVLIDRSNQNIKYVDSSFRYISAQDLSSKPWAVCARNVDVYVTVGNTHIQHLCIKDMLIEHVRTFEVRGRCLGICMFGEYIAVGLQIGEVHLLDTMGEKHGTVQLPVLDNGKPCNPWQMSVSHETNLLITDSDSGVVFCMNKESQIIFSFREMSLPRAITVDFYGNFLVVGRDKESGVVVKILPRDWELQGMLHIEHAERTGSKRLLTWKELEFVPYCVDFRKDNVVVLGGIRESLKIMKLVSPHIAVPST